MIDLDKEFQGLDVIPDPDLSREIERRVEAGPVGQDLPTDRSPRPTSRLVAAMVALAVFFAAAVFAWRAFTPIRNHPPASVSPSVEDPWGNYPEGWSELPPEPEVRDGADMVWMGDRLLVWGGSPRGVDGAASAADGFVFDPTSGTWTAIPPAPVAGTGGDAVWTGSEVLLWGVHTSDGEVALAFDPGAQSWKRIAGPPQGPRFGATHVWTGRELILFGGGLKGSPTTKGGAVYDPSTDTWRVILSAPVGMNLADAVWTGSEMIIIGSELDNRNSSETRTAMALAYDPAADSWRRLPDPPISPQTSAVAYVDGRVIAWEAYIPGSAEYLPSEDRWRSLDTGGLQRSECYAEGATIGHDVFTWNCGTQAVWYAQTSSWVATAPPLPASDTQPTYSWASVTAAGSAVIADQVETVLGQGGEPYLGSPDAPAHLWLWRPPSMPLVAPIRVPNGDDAGYLLNNFLSALSESVQPYLHAYATADVLAKIEPGGGLDLFQAAPLRTWRFPDHPWATDLGGGRFEVRVTLTLKDGGEPTVVFDIGPGTTGDGRDAQLVVTDVRLDGT